MAAVERMTPEEVLEYTLESQLVTLSPATAGQRNDRVKLTIDGVGVEVPRVVIDRDADQKPKLDEFGQAKYRYTTIFDAATELAIEQNKPTPIQVLCHREHMPPVGACRMCMVEVHKGGKREPDLSTACKRVLDRDIEVHTVDSPDADARERVRRVVRTVAELLMADQPDPAEHARPADAKDATKELSRIARKVEVPAAPRYGNGLAKRPKDASSPVIAVDHSACVLCDRCIRACTDVKKNFVIGRTGRGYDARIGFDLDDPMGDSTCVSCMECAFSCPTTAITVKEAVAQPIERGGEPVAWHEVAEHPLFRELSQKWLESNPGSYWRRRYKKGETVCRQGEYGTTAFVIEKGRFEVRVATVAPTDKKYEGLFGWFDRYKTVKTGADGERADAVLTPDDLLFGEMTCLSNYPRSATVVAVEDGCSLLVVRRNVLHLLKRNMAPRRLLDRTFLRGALGSFLGQVGLFERILKDEARAAALRAFFAELVGRGAVRLVHADPKQVIYRQGDVADCVDLIRTGFVQVSQTAADGKRQVVRNYVGPKGYVGELAVLGGYGPFDERFRAEGGRMRADFVTGRRTATVRAVDHVELIRIPAADFRRLYDSFPEIHQKIADTIADYDANLREEGGAKQPLPDTKTLAEFLEQGLVNARNLLVLDLEKCTRCDECTRACADSHDGTTRLIRDGLRFDKFLVASSCRACQDPYCMVGCPVDAIHRRPSGEMTIENWCIGCELCSRNCPYGNITMQKVRPASNWPIAALGGRAELKTKATICDLCMDTPHKTPSCVYACPHDAAHRMTGQDLLGLVEAAGR